MALKRPLDEGDTPPAKKPRLEPKRVGRPLIIVFPAGMGDIQRLRWLETVVFYPDSTPFGGTLKLLLQETAVLHQWDVERHGRLMPAVLETIRGLREGGDKEDVMEQFKDDFGGDTPSYLTKYNLFDYSPDDLGWWGFQVGKHGFKKGMLLTDCDCIHLDTCDRTE